MSPWPAALTFVGVSSGAGADDHVLSRKSLRKIRHRDCGFGFEVDRETVPMENRGLQHLQSRLDGAAGDLL